MSAPLGGLLQWFRTGRPIWLLQQRERRVGCVGPRLVMVAGNKRSGFVMLLLVGDFVTELREGG